ncbi:MAG: hypothetical protein HRF50_10960 [Phycisphaerae bacterium]|jgi:hypothetical protein
MPAKKNEKTLPIVERALANRIAAHRAGNIGDATDDGRKADLAVKAAYIALKAHEDMSWLRDKLSEAIERVAIAETTKDAHMALVWLRTSLWDDVQAALTKLEAYDDLLA